MFARVGRKLILHICTYVNVSSEAFVVQIQQRNLHVFLKKHTRNTVAKLGTTQVSLLSLVFLTGV